MSSEKQPQGLTIQNILTNLPHVVETRRAKLEHLETKEDIEQFEAIYANQTKRLDDIIDWNTKNGSLFGLIGEYPLTYEPIANLDRSAESVFNYVAGNKKIVHCRRNIFTKRRKLLNSIYVKQVVGGYYIPDKKGVNIEFDEYYQLRWAKIYVRLDAVNNLPDDSDERKQIFNYLERNHRDFYDALIVSDDSEPPSRRKKQNSTNRSSKSPKTATNSPIRSSKLPKTATNSSSRSSKLSKTVTNSSSRASESPKSVTNSPSRSSNSSRTKQNSASKVPNSNKTVSESTRKSNPTKRMPAKKVKAPKGNSTITPSSSTSSELNHELQQQTEETSSSSETQLLLPIGSIIGPLEKTESLKALEAIVDERECITTVSDGNSRTSKKRVAKRNRRKPIKRVDDQLDDEELERIIAANAKLFEYEPKFDKKVNESLKQELAKYPALALTVFHYQDKTIQDNDARDNKPLFLVIMVHFINQTTHLPSNGYKVENLLLSFEEVPSTESEVTLTVFERTFSQYGLDKKYLVVVSELSLNLRSSLKSRFKNCHYLQCNWEIMVNHILNGKETSRVSKPLIKNLIRSSDDNNIPPKVDAIDEYEDKIDQLIASAKKMKRFLQNSNKTTKELLYDLTSNHLLTVWFILREHLQEQKSTDSWSAKLNATILARIKRLEPIYRVACFLNPFDLSEWMSSSSAGEDLFGKKDQNDIEIEFMIFEKCLSKIVNTDKGKTQTASDAKTNDDDSSLEPQIKRRKRLRDEIERIQLERESNSPKVKQQARTIKQEMIDYIDLVKKNPNWGDWCQFTFWESGCFSFPRLKQAAQFFLSIPATIQPSVRLLEDAMKQVEGNIEEYSAQVKLSRIINNEYLMDDDEDDDNANENENEDENRQSDNVSADAEQINNEDNPDQGMNQIGIANQTSV